MSIEAAYREKLADVCFEYQPDRLANPHGYELWERWLIAKGFAKKLGLRTK